MNSMFNRSLALFLNFIIFHMFGMGYGLAATGEAIHYDPIDKGVIKSFIDEDQVGSKSDKQLRDNIINNYPNIKGRCSDFRKNPAQFNAKAEATAQTLSSIAKMGQEVASTSGPAYCIGFWKNPPVLAHVGAGVIMTVADLINSFAFSDDASELSEDTSATSAESLSGNGIARGLYKQILNTNNTIKSTKTKKALLITSSGAMTLALGLAITWAIIKATAKSGAPIAAQAAEATIQATNPMCNGSSGDGTAKGVAKGLNVLKNVVPLMQGLGEAGKYVNAGIGATDLIKVLLKAGKKGDVSFHNEMVGKLNKKANDSLKKAIKKGELDEAQSETLAKVQNKSLSKGYILMSVIFGAQAALLWTATSQYAKTQKNQAVQRETAMCSLLEGTLSLDDSSVDGPTEAFRSSPPIDGPQTINGELDLDLQETYLYGQAGPCINAGQGGLNVENPGSSGCKGKKLFPKYSFKGIEGQSILNNVNDATPYLNSMAAGNYNAASGQFSQFQNAIAKVKKQLPALKKKLNKIMQKEDKKFDIDKLIEQRKKKSYADLGKAVGMSGGDVAKLFNGEKKSDKSLANAIKKKEPIQKITKSEVKKGSAEKAKEDDGFDDLFGDDEEVVEKDEFSNDSGKEEKDFSQYEMSSADIVKRPSTSIFKILSNRYYLNYPKMLEKEKKKNK